MSRLDDFFSHEEIQPAVRYPSPEDSDVSIIVVSYPHFITIKIEFFDLCRSNKNAHFKWDLKGESSDFALENLNFTAR